MKIFAKVTMAVGVVAVLLGGGGMDSQSLITPILMIFLGMGLIYIGSKIDGDYL